MAADFDRRNSAWYIDKLVQVLVFIGGISAIIFVVGIFAFITKEGFGFILDRFDFMEFFTSPYWYPAEEEDPEYGILALIAGTASVTGLAMLVARSISPNLPLARPGRPSRSWWNCWPPSPRWYGALSVSPS